MPRFLRMSVRASARVGQTLISAYRIDMSMNMPINAMALRRAFGLLTVSALLIACNNGDASEERDEGDSDSGTRAESRESVGKEPVCSGKAATPGLTERSLQLGATVRTYLLYIPQAFDPDIAATVVLVFHPFGLTAENMLVLTGFDSVADEEGFIAAFPQGTSDVTPWNVGESVCGVGSFVGGAENDLGFVEAMLDDIESVQCIDRSRVFATGFSMGAYFVNNLGCQRGDLIRAIAPHSGGTYPDDCVDGPIPVLLIHGTGDFIVATNCGIQARDRWVERNGCSADYDTVPIKGGHCEQHRDCPENGQVELCLLDGMCHGWAGYGNGTCLDSGGGENFEDATHLVWRFFSDHK